MRITKFFLLIGVTLLIVSILPTSSRGSSMQVTKNNYTVRFLFINDGVSLHMESRINESFSVYILSEVDSYHILSNKSLNGTSPFFVTANVTQIQMILKTPHSGWYGIVITTDMNYSISVRYRIAQVIPRITYYVSSIVLLSISIPLYVLQNKFRLTSELGEVNVMDVE